MKTLVVEHPLIAAKVTELRDKQTPMPRFQQLATELVGLLAFEATKELDVEKVEVITPVSPTTGVKLTEPLPLLVPILRAGLGMLSGMQQVIPNAEVGFLGVVRNEETLLPAIYADRMPARLDNRTVIVLDPMLATGGSLIAAIEIMLARGAKKVIAITLISAPEGVEAVGKKFANQNVTVVTSALDEKLNERGYIVPGLGDAGDRLFGAC
ncbi:MAG: uracil phosphoribosyltransferase [Actinobacteria bacterium]|nr:uracil phosphoribosyltransferase [Actinomycetota bacterium]